MATALTFSPFTAFEVLFGTTLEAVLREKSGKQGNAFLQQFKALAAVPTGRRTLTEGLRKRATQAFREILPPDFSIKLGAPDEPVEFESPWKTTAFGCARRGAEPTDWLYEAAILLARYDEEIMNLIRIAHTDKGAADSALLALFPGAVEAWMRFDDRSSLRLVFPAETALDALANVEASISAQVGESEPLVEPLLAVGRRPIGHWIRGVCAAAPGQPSLRALSSRSGISESTLKKWSSSREIAMPEDRLGTVLNVVLDQGRRDRLRGQFFAARVLTFLCDVVRSSSQRESPPAWEEVQAFLLERYGLATKRQAPRQT